MTKQDILLEWIKQQPYVISYQAKRWGIEELHLFDTDRRCREWVKAGKLERLSVPQKKMMGIKPRFVVWKYMA